MNHKRGFDRTGKRKATLLKFRAIVLTVIFNRKWLIDVEEQRVTLNYKRNIAMIVRTQKKIGILTLDEKALIRKIHEFRTIEERKKLVTLMAGLDCFAHIPPKVRARLVPVIKFIDIDAGQVVMREGAVPITVYFILSGEVEVSKKFYDARSNEYKNQVEYINGPGDCIGDIDFYENRAHRRNTYTATQLTEVLVIYDDDFDLILRPYMSQQWENRKKALKALDYFNFFDEEQIQTACRLGVVRQFEPLENIYFEDRGAVSYVHFILSGECMILQRLRVKVRERKGEKIYKLLTILPDKNSSKEFGGKMTVEVMNQLKLTTSKIGSEFSLASDKLFNELDQEDNNAQRQRGQEELAKVEAACHHRSGKSNPFLKKSKSAHSVKSYRSLKSERSRKQKKLKSEKVLNVQELNGDDADRASINTAVTTRTLDEENAEEEASIKAATSNRSLKSNVNNAEEASLNISSSFKSLAVSLDTADKVINEQKYNEQFVNFEEEEEEIPKEQEEEDSSSTFSSSSSLSSSSSSSSSSVFTSFWSEDHKTKFKHHAQRTRLENHFVDVGSLFYHGIFGLGEELIDRNIMARTAVQCLLLPRFWLFERDQNPANAWGRRRFYLDSNIPSRLALFENFMKTREWKAFKNDYVESHIKDFIGNPTKKEDIPIIGLIVDE